MTSDLEKQLQDSIAIAALRRGDLGTILNIAGIVQVFPLAPQPPTITTYAGDGPPTSYIVRSDSPWWPETRAAEEATREARLKEIAHDKSAEAIETQCSVLFKQHGTRYYTERAIALLQEVLKAQVELEGDGDAA